MEVEGEKPSRVMPVRKVNTEEYKKKKQLESKKLRAAGSPSSLRKSSGNHKTLEQKAMAALKKLGGDKQGVLKIARAMKKGSAAKLSIGLLRGYLLKEVAAGKLKRNSKGQFSIIAEGAKAKKKKKAVTAKKAALKTKKTAAAEKKKTRATKDKGTPAKKKKKAVEKKKRAAKKEEEDDEEVEEESTAAATEEEEGGSGSGKVLWQYQENGWHPYEEEANRLVEEQYQEFLKNPIVDVRSVQSGSWAYSLDFTAMKQTNIQHRAHTVRDVRRTIQ